MSTTETETAALLQNRIVFISSVSSCPQILINTPLKHSPVSIFAFCGYLCSYSRAMSAGWALAASRGCQATSNPDDICNCKLWIYPRVVQSGTTGKPPDFLDLWSKCLNLHCFPGLCGRCVIADFNICSIEEISSTGWLRQSFQRKMKPFSQLRHIFGAGEGGTQCPVRRGPWLAQQGDAAAYVCTWHHGLLWKGSVAAASRLCSPSAILWLHRPSTVWAGRFTQALTAWDTRVSTLIVSPFIHDERLHHTRCRGGKLFPALASVLQLYSLSLS